MSKQTNSQTGLHFRVVCGWAGVAWVRASSPVAKFADANREAMEACVRLDRAVRVYAYGGRGDSALVAEYVPVNGRAQCVPVEVTNG